MRTVTLLALEQLQYNAIIKHKDFNIYNIKMIWLNDKKHR